VQRKTAQGVSWHGARDSSVETKSGADLSGSNRGQATGCFRCHQHALSCYYVGPAWIQSVPPAVAGGYAVRSSPKGLRMHPPATQVVLTVSKPVERNVATHKPQKSKRGPGGYDSLHQSSNRPQ